LKQQENKMLSTTSSSPSSVDTASIQLTTSQVQSVSLTSTDTSQSIYFMMQSTPIDLLSTSNSSPVNPVQQAQHYATATGISPESFDSMSMLTTSSPMSPGSTDGGLGGSSMFGGPMRVVRDERRRANHNEGNQNSSFNLQILSISFEIKKKRRKELFRFGNYFFRDTSTVDFQTKKTLFLILFFFIHTISIMS
jgi:hypothetical protein